MSLYIIKDMQKFCKTIRDEAVVSLSANISKKTDIDEFITIKQCEEIVGRKCISHDDYGRLILNKDLYVDILQEIAEQIYQSALSKLAASDIIECAWDEKLQKMTFWTYKDNSIKNIDYTPLQ